MYGFGGKTRPAITNAFSRVAVYDVQEFDADHLSEDEEEEEEEMEEEEKRI